MAHQQMQWLSNTSNARLDGTQALNNAIRNSQLQNAAAALDNGQAVDAQRNRDRDRHEVVFPALAHDFDADPRGALFRNIDPTIPRASVEQWADDNLDNVLPYMQNARETEAEMQTNPEYLFLQQVLSYVQDKNSGLTEQLTWGSIAAPAHAAPGLGQSNIRITVDAQGSAAAAAAQQQVGGPRLGAIARPTAVQPGDMVFASNAAAGAAAAVGANARHTLDTPQTTGRFVINSQLTAVCNQAIASLVEADISLFANSNLQMFIQNTDVRNAFASLVGETYLLNKLKSPNRKMFIYGHDYEHKTKSQLARIRYMKNNLQKVGDHFEMIPAHLKKSNLYKYADLFQ